MGTTHVKIERGKVTMDGQGFSGDACRKAHDPYVQRLRPSDGAIAEEVTKPEMFESQDTEQQQTQE